MTCLAGGWHRIAHARRGRVEEIKQGRRPGKAEQLSVFCRAGEWVSAMKVVRWSGSPVIVDANQFPARHLRKGGLVKEELRFSDIRVGLWREGGIKGRWRILAIARTIHGLHASAYPRETRQSLAGHEQE